MTEHRTISTEKVPAAERTAPGSATKAARRAPASAEQRERLIAIEAYYRAERRGFAPGHELEDWCEAEAEIDRRHARG